MPDVNPNETKQDFISRCVPIVINDGTTKDPTQAAAICNSKWAEYEKGQNSDNSAVQMKTLTVDTFISPEFDPNKLTEHQQTILSHTYAACRREFVDKHPGDRENMENKQKCSQIAWGAVNKSKNAQEIPQDPELFESDWIPYIREGAVIRGKTITKKYLTDIVNNYNPKKYINAPLMLGHTTDNISPLDLRKYIDTVPRYGDISDIKFENGRIWIKLANLTRQAFDWIKRKLYNQISWEVYEKLDDASIPTPQLTGLALLGATIPAVAGSTISLSNFGTLSNIMTIDIKDLDIKPNKMSIGGTMPEQIDPTTGLPITPEQAQPSGTEIPTKPSPPANFDEAVKLLGDARLQVQKLLATIAQLEAKLQSETAMRIEAQQASLLANSAIPPAWKDNEVIKQYALSFIKTNGHNKVTKLADGKEVPTADIFKQQIEALYNSGQIASKLSNSTGKEALDEDQAVLARYKAQFPDAKIDITKEK